MIEQRPPEWLYSNNGSVKIDGVLLARDDGNGKPGEIATSFKPSDRTIHGVVKLDHLENGLKVKFSWVAVAAAGSVNQTIAEQEFSALTETTLYGILVLPQDWPTGKYRLDISVNDTLAQSVDFTIA